MRFSVLICCVILSVSVYGQASDFNFIDFEKADSIAALYPNHSLKNLKMLADKLTTPLPTEIEKFRAIYKWICNNIEYDYALYIRSKEKERKLKGETLQAWNKTFSSLVFKTLLNKQKTVCSGYAYLVKALASQAGLHCVMIDGYGRTSQSNIGGKGNANHSWNAIQLNGKWYLCDATWSAGAYDTEALKYVKRFDDSYFLAEPSMFVRNHFPLDSAWTLLNHKPTLNNFLNGPLFYSNAFKYKINLLSPETFDVVASKDKPVIFQFTKNADTTLEQVELYIKGPGASNIMSPKLYEKSAGLYCFDHTFTTRGTYVVHLLLNHSFVTSYTVTVGKE
ncbi:MAG TPA: transglutaminase domain-containing protein [Cyclobacteriaceae bacterium]